jgi:preprotein translocase subunit SecE
VATVDVARNEEGGEMTDSRADRRDGAEVRTSPVTFYRQVLAELRKVVWPTQEQLITYFIVTLIFVAFFMTMVSALDLGFGKLVFEIFGGGGQ